MANQYTYKKIDLPHWVNKEMGVVCGGFLQNRGGIFHTLLRFNPNKNEYDWVLASVQQSIWVCRKIIPDKFASKEDALEFLQSLCDRRTVTRGECDLIDSTVKFNDAGTAEIFDLSRMVSTYLSDYDFIEFDEYFAHDYQCLFIADFKNFTELDQSKLDEQLQYQQQVIYVLKNIK